METKNYNAEIERLKKELADVEAAKAADEAEKKKLASEARKAEASKVEEAFKNLNAISKENTEILTQAKQEYLNVANDAANKYNKIVRERNTILEQAQKTYNDALDEFDKNHPEGYHLTLRDGDNIQTVYSNTSSICNYDDLFEYMFNKNKKLIEEINKMC